MAERVTGRYSPGAPRAGKGPYKGRRRTRAGGRANLLYLVPLPLAVRAFGQDPVGLALDLGALGILLLAAWLTREGLTAEEAYEARKVARRPAIPRKILGALALGLGLAVAGTASAGGLLAPVIFAVLGTSLHLMAFGLDPLADKTAGGDEFQSGRVARAVEEAERHLASMADAIRPLGDAPLARRVESFQTTARDLFRRVEEDPRDLTAARRYLGVYLLGARDAAAKYAEIARRGDAPEARAALIALLEDLEGSFAARTDKLLVEDRTGLDIEIDVLRERLAREGLRPADTDTDTD